MKISNNLKKGVRKQRPNYILNIKSIILAAFILTGTLITVQAQEAQYSKPSWWFGGAAGANFNFFRGSTQQLSPGLMAPAAFQKGSGVGLYLAPLIEFHRPETRIGFMLQAGYDSRKGQFDQIVTPCNCPADLSTNLNYITIEPSLRLAPFKSNFYLYGGPRFAFNMDKSFKYQIGINPDFPDQTADPELTGDFSKVYKSVISMQIGAGYDIELSSQDNEKQAVLSPFVAVHPYFGQDPRSIETWNMTTVRLGATLKFGRGKKIATPVKVEQAEAIVPIPLPDVTFSVISPSNIRAENSMSETFPLRNYIFFDQGSTNIPDRYVLLTKEQVQNFKTYELEVIGSANPSGRSDRQMAIYYNILNILGDRMVKNPSANIQLAGSSRVGKDDGLAMAESVKQYLANVFEINPSRIKTEGLDKPVIASEQLGATKELVLIREGDRRVSILSNSPELLMEFTSGSETALVPANQITVQEAPIESYVNFNVDGATEAFSSWSLEISDESGTMKTFGPFTQEEVSLPGQSILGTRPSGNYKATMVGKRPNGQIVRKEEPVHLVLWTPIVNEEGTRFSVIFEFDQSKVSSVYEKYLTEVVVPKIPKNGTVIINGYTDIIGDAANNQKLSLARAEAVGNIIKGALLKGSRSDVKIEVTGSGENESVAQFENKYPEERFYNRAVIIDVNPPM